jgi:hypothetical protein
MYPLLPLPPVLMSLNPLHQKVIEIGAILFAVGLLICAVTGLVLKTDEDQESDGKKAVRPIVLISLGLMILGISSFLFGLYAWVIPAIALISVVLYLAAVSVRSLF